MSTFGHSERETILQLDSGFGFWIRWISIVIISVLIILSSVSLLWAKPGSSLFKASEQKYLIDIMVDETQFSPDFLQGIFEDPRLKKISILTERNVYNKENPRNYKDFLSSYSVKRAHRFSKKWRTMLARAAKKFQVDQEVLVAIMQVESSLGHYTGRYPVISVFSSILIAEKLAEKDLGSNADLNEDEEYRLMRLRRKGQWARVELAALLKISKTTHYTPFDIKGSYAGAFGIPQFLPSSYLKWGFDSDNSGSVNLYLVPDAIYSTANYLKSHGWKKGLNKKKNKRVIWKYNNSQVYANTVISLAKKIKSYGIKRAMRKGIAGVDKPGTVQVSMLTP